MDSIKINKDHSFTPFFVDFLISSDIHPPPFHLPLLTKVVQTHALNSILVLFCSFLQLAFLCLFISYLLFYLVFLSLFSSIFVWIYCWSSYFLMYHKLKNHRINYHLSPHFLYHKLWGHASTINAPIPFLPFLFLFLALMWEFHSWLKSIFKHPHSHSWKGPHLVKNWAPSLFPIKYLHNCQILICNSEQAVSLQSKYSRW